MTAPFIYGVICMGRPSCGAVELSAEEYDRQMDRPNQTWVCPRCGDAAEWDDDSLITSDQDDDE